SKRKILTWRKRGRPRVRRSAQWPPDDPSLSGYQADAAAGDSGQRRQLPGISTPDAVKAAPTGGHPAPLCPAVAPPEDRPAVPAEVDPDVAEDVVVEPAV